MAAEHWWVEDMARYIGQIGQTSVIRWASSGKANVQHGDYS